MLLWSRILCNWKSCLFLLLYRQLPIHIDTIYISMLILYKCGRSPHPHCQLRMSVLSGNHKTCHIGQSVTIVAMQNDWLVDKSSPVVYTSLYYNFIYLPKHTLKTLSNQFTPSGPGPGSTWLRLLCSSLAWRGPSVVLFCTTTVLPCISQAKTIIVQKHCNTWKCGCWTNASSQLSLWSLHWSVYQWPLNSLIQMYPQSLLQFWGCRCDQKDFLDFILSWIKGRQTRSVSNQYLWIQI